MRTGQHVPVLALAVLAAHPVRLRVRDHCPWWPVRCHLQHTLPACALSAAKNLVATRARSDFRVTHRAATTGCRSGLQQYLDHAVLLLLEDLIAVRRLVKRHPVRRKTF